MRSNQRNAASLAKGRWPGRIAAAVALMLAMGFTTGAHAGVVAYAYAQQQISNFRLGFVTPGAALTNVSAVTTGSSDGATINGSGVSSANPTDASQSFLGTTSPPLENTFAPYATLPSYTTGTVPSGPPAPFSRGDSQIVAGTSANGVAESYVVDNGFNNANAGFTAFFSFGVTAPTALSLMYDYNNLLYTVTSGGGQATASVKFNITITNLANQVVFDSASFNPGPGSINPDSNTNISIAAPPNGPSVSRTGTNSYTTGSLLTGDTYTLTFSAQDLTFASTETPLNAVPEPASIALALVAGLGTLGVKAFRRRVA